MVDRYKPIFFAIISLTIVWFIIVLLCLPQQQDDKLLLLDQQQQPYWSALTANNKHPHGIPSNSRQQTINYSSGGNALLEENEHYPRRVPEYMRYFHQLNAKKKHHQELSKLDVIFYQLNTLSNASTDDQPTPPVTKDQHHKETLELRAIKNPTDRYVKLEGDKLFAFNLLVSNRIGLFRPLPDTRHAKCLDSTATSTLEEQQAKQLSQQPNNNNNHANHKASIIICYYNEAPSALLRTIYSILRRTDRQYMQEIIVVDDSSEAEYDIVKVKPFLNDDPLVILTRTKRREGLIRARLFGADLAKGQILLFLDSHVEPNVGWIEPLIGAVQQNKTTIACPIIDLINAETLLYSSSPLVKGGMNWALNFKWDSVPTEKLKTYDDFVKPIESPTMAGGLFAIDKDYFHTLGSYDPGMELWGGENIELSLRTWMCGGQIVILPCSRVGHIFRKRRPYGPEPNQPDSLLLNSHRVARVWLDEYIEKFYEANPDAKYLISGDVSKRLDLRHRLGCKKFSWFLENVYPDLLDSSNKKLAPSAESPAAKFRTQRNSRPQRQVQATSMQHIPGGPVAAGGRQENVMMMIDSESGSSTHILPKMINQFQIQSRSSDLCIESKRVHTGGGGGFGGRLVLSRCARIERNNEGEILIGNSSILDQIWTETEWHDLRLGPSRCLDVFKNLPLLRKCHTMGTFQDWSHNNSNNNNNNNNSNSSVTVMGDAGSMQPNQTSDTNIFNTRAGLCLGVERVQINEPIIVTICDKETYERHNYTKPSAVRSSSNYQSWRWRQATTTMTGGAASPKSTLGGASGLIRRQSHQTRPSQSWTLLLVTRDGSGSKSVRGEEDGKIM